MHITNFASVPCDDGEVEEHRPNSGNQLCMYQVHWHCVLWQISVIIIVVIDKPILKAQSGEGGEEHCEVQLRCIVVSPSAMTDKFAHQ